MSDLSTREQIRNEAVERLASWQHELDYAKYPELKKLPWGEMSQAQRESYRAAVSGFVDALGDLLPTGQESRVHPCDCHPCPECETAALADGAVRQHRYTHDWTEVTE